MKKHIVYSIFLTFFFLIFFNDAKCNDGNHIRERLYISTDRGVYVCGEAIWLSAYCFDISKENISLSSLSCIAYIELHNNDAVVLTCKVALNDGRGSGRIELPPTLPTGNYRLIAYTKQMLNEKPVAYFDKIISIYNTLTSEKVKDNVDIEEDGGAERKPFAGFAGPKNYYKSGQFSLEIGNGAENFDKNSSLPLKVVNKGNSAATMNISVVRVDSIPYLHEKNIESVLSSYKEKGYQPDFSENYLPEFEGEIIKCKVSGNSKMPLTGKIAFLSASHGESDIYSSLIGEGGEMYFYTNSLFGEREIVLEIPDADSTGNLTFELSDPFARPVLAPAPVLTISKRFESSLMDRNIEMQIGKRYETDTLFERILVKNNPFLNLKPALYILDEYTRFPAMQDLVVEFIPELRFRKTDGIVDLQVRCENEFNMLSFSKNNSLVIIDGIPVFNHKRVLNYDPLKVKSISVYTKEFIIGEATFNGVVALKTNKGDYQGLTFNKNVSVMDYKGVLHPCRFTSKELVKGSALTDLRSTLFFDPLVNIERGEDKTLTIYTPSYSGTFQVTVEGVDTSGKPFCIQKSFVVK